MSAKEILLPDLPKGKEYEEYIAAIFQASGYYIEKNIIDRKEEEILELDIIFTNYNQKYPRVKLIEVKSGSWGFNDIFRIRGWMDYTGIRSGKLIVATKKDSMDFINKIAKDLKIEIIAEDLSNTQNVFQKYKLTNEIEEIDIETWRYSYWIERNILRNLKELKKNNLNLECYIAIDKYHHKVQSSIFFTQNIIDRLRLLYNAFQEHPHITAKSAHEVNGGRFKLMHTNIPENMFKDAFYNCKLNVVQLATYTETLARLKILKNAVDYILYRNAGVKYKTNVREVLFEDIEISELDFLPSNFIENLEKISEDKYFNKYPIFWQWFLWVFGGFVLLDYETEEYELFSMKTGIPVEEIPNALNAFDTMFPMLKSWLVKLPNSNIKIMQMFPVPFRGIGAHYRKTYYVSGREYSSLNLTGQHTENDLQNWNNMAVEVLDLYK